MDWGPVNAALLTVAVFLLGWIRTDLHRVSGRVDKHLEGHP